MNLACVPEIAPKVPQRTLERGGYDSKWLLYLVLARGYDFAHDRLANHHTIRLLGVLDEYTRECLTIEVGRSMTSQDVMLTLSRLMRLHGKPRFIRSDQGAEFTAARVMAWLRDRQVGPAFIPPGKPWHNGSSKASTASCATKA